MEVTDDQMVPVHLHVPQELKYAIGRDDIKEEAWVRLGRGTDAAPYIVAT